MFRQGGARQQLMEEKMEVVRFDSLPSVARTFICMARAARLHARAHISHFMVGATVGVGASDPLIIADGCNSENSILEVEHAEQAAIARLVMATPPHMPLRIDMMAVALVAEREDQHALPCGLCRQELREFGNDDMVIYGAKLNATGDVWQVEVTTLGELLPYSFGPNNLKK